MTPPDPGLFLGEDFHQVKWHQPQPIPLPREHMWFYSGTAQPLIPGAGSARQTEADVSDRAQGSKEPNPRAP